MEGNIRREVTEVADDRLTRFIATSSTTECVVAGEDGTVLAANAAFAEHVGGSAEEVAGRSIYDHLTAPDVERVERWLTGGTPPTEPVRLNFVGEEGAAYTLRCLVDRTGEGLRLLGEPEAGRDLKASDDLMRLNNELATMAREEVRRQRELERTRRKLEDALDELRKSYWHLQKIQEVLPLCMRCGKVKTDEAHWQTVVEYMQENEIFLSHGYCPSCSDVVLREYGVEPSPE